MKQVIAIFSLVVLMNTMCCSVQGEEAPKARAAKVQWLTSYEEATNQAKTSNRPIVLFFTGSDWCGWCNKLEEEVFDSQDFANLAADKFVFVKLDYPLYKQQDAKLNAQNKELQKKYAIRSYPTLVVLDPQDQQQIGVTGYRPGGGRQYAGHLQKLVSDFTAYKEKVRNLDKNKLSGADLKKLYEKSKELDLDNDTTYLIKVGMDSDEKSFFLTERYRFLAEEGQIHDPEAVALRQQLLALDPNNEKKTHYDIAVIEFEAFSEEMAKENYSADLAVAPLVEYIARFGNQDKSNLWRLEMIVSQVFLDKNRIQDALKHAKASYESAPSGVQPEIAAAIKNIESQLATSSR